MANIKIKLIKGLAGCKEKQLATAASLGLRRIGHETIQPDNPATRGKIRVIAHLVSVTEA